MLDIKNAVPIPQNDVLEALGLSAAQLKKRIDEGIYPKPRRNETDTRNIYTLGWLHVARIREAQLKQVLASVAASKDKRQRLQRDIKELLAT